ncbi:MAG: LysR family transcriptional regulator [Rhizobiaceae bacterium]
MEIKPRYLRYLAAIGARGSFVKAADLLNISQPALSLSIQRIEDITKTRLVDRGRHGAVLTAAGEALARHGSQIDGVLLSAAEEIGLLSSGISGHLRVGGTPLSTDKFIPTVISRILNLTNDVAISVVEGVEENLLDMVSKNELDLMIGAPGGVTNRPEFSTQPLFFAKTVLVVRPGHPLLQEPVVSLENLENAVWAIPPHGGSFRSQIEALFTVNGIPFPRRTVQASSIHVLKRIVRLSNAVTLAAEQIVSEEVEQGQLNCIEVTEPVAVRAFGLHTKADRNLGDLGKLFCDLAVEIAPQFSFDTARA